MFGTHGVWSYFPNFEVNVDVVNVPHVSNARSVAALHPYVCGRVDRGARRGPDRPLRLPRHHLGSLRRPDQRLHQGQLHNSTCLLLKI